MLRSGLVIAATALCAACPAPRGPSREVRDETIVRVQIAKLEAARDHGQVQLAGLVRDGEQSTSVLALRALGRIDSDEAGRALIAYAGGVEGGAAAAALGLASALAEPGLEQTALRTDALLAAYHNDTEHRAAILEGMGRAADLRALPALAEALGSTDHAAAAAAGIALGRFGRRKLALDAVATNALVVATRSPAREVRYAATYALRQHAQTATASAPRAANKPIAAALAARIADDDPEIRAQAIIGLGKLDELDAARPAVEQALGDRDWRVAVEAVRALGAERGGHANDAPLIAIVPRWTAQLASAPPAAHVVMEALRALATNGVSPAIAPMLRQLVVPAAAPPIVRGWVTCLASAARVHLGDGTLADLATCGNGDLPDHLRLPLVGEAITRKDGDLAARRTQLAALLAHADVRVRAAGLGALVGIWPDGNDDDHRAAIAALTAAIGSAEGELVGAATEAVPGLAKLAAPADLVELDAAIIARATRETDPELAAGLLELIGTRKLPAGATACRAALTGHPVRVRAAEGCLRELGEPVPAALVPVAPPVPPVDVAGVIGKTVRWHVVTSRGEIVIALRPDVAPWAVATIVALTRAGFYDKHELHRVVPDFVVQGGDPTETGNGGPGYTIPAEPSTSEDGAGFVAGGVGMADAGPDSGGSQFFIMHARAPHLDARYTWVGAVESGQTSADSLVVGDVIVRATVEVTGGRQPAE